jgi:hypothetical protein
VVCFKVLSQHLPRDTEENEESGSVDRLQADIPEDSARNGLLTQP